MAAGGSAGRQAGASPQVEVSSQLAGCEQTSDRLCPRMQLPSDMTNGSDEPDRERSEEPTCGRGFGFGGKQEGRG
jgi:hypothetical protein